MTPRIVPYDNTLYKLLGINEKDNLEIFPRASTEDRVKTVLEELSKDNDEDTKRTRELLNETWKYLGQPPNEIQYRMYGEADLNYPRCLKSYTLIEAATKHIKKIIKSKHNRDPPTEKPDSPPATDVVQQQEVDNAINSILEHINKQPMTALNQQTDTDEHSCEVLNWNDDTLNTPTYQMSEPESDGIGKKSPQKPNQNAETRTNNPMEQEEEMREDTSINPKKTNQMKKSKQISSSKTKPTHNQYERKFFGETKIKAIIEHSTRRGKTKAKVLWNDKDETTTWEELPELLNHPEELGSYLEFLKIKKKRSYKAIQEKHGYLIENIKRTQNDIKPKIKKNPEE